MSTLLLVIASVSPYRAPAAAASHTTRSRPWVRSPATAATATRAPAAMNTGSQALIPGLLNPATGGETARNTTIPTVTSSAPTMARRPSRRRCLRAIMGSANSTSVAAIG